MTTGGAAKEQVLDSCLLTIVRGASFFSRCLSGRSAYTVVCLSVCLSLSLSACVCVCTCVCTYIHDFTHDNYTRNLQETQLSLTNRATHMCKCSGVARWLTSYKHAPPHMCYHSEFGRSALKGVSKNTGEPPKLKSHRTPLFW